MSFATMYKSCHVSGLSFPHLQSDGTVAIVSLIFQAIFTLLFKSFMIFMAGFSLDTIFLIIAHLRSNIFVLNIWHPFKCLKKSIKVYCNFRKAHF